MLDYSSLPQVPVEDLRAGMLAPLPTHPGIPPREEDKVVYLQAQVLEEGLLVTWLRPTESGYTFLEALYAPGTLLSIFPQE